MISVPENAFADNLRWTEGRCTEAEAERQQAYGRTLKRHLGVLIAGMLGMAIVLAVYRLVGNLYNQLWMSFVVTGFMVVVTELLLNFDRVLGKGYVCDKPACSEDEVKLQERHHSEMKRKELWLFLAFSTGAIAAVADLSAWLTWLLVMSSFGVVTRCCISLHDGSHWYIWRHERFTGVVHDWD